MWALFVTLLAFAEAQDGCVQGGCRGPHGSGVCEAVLTPVDRATGRPDYERAIRRCRNCPAGWTGVDCRRPCQNMMQQCTSRWEEERRCEHRRLTAFFDDNCPLSCGICTPGDFELEVPIPILAEQVAWVMGRWEADVSDSVRFPINMEGPYKEILDIRPEKVTMFDRPSLNVSITAHSGRDSRNVHQELGFLTSRFGNEDTGFERQKDHPGLDAREIGLSLNSNTGVNTVEEGVMSEGGGRIDFKLLWIIGVPSVKGDLPANATRSWSVVGDTLTEYLNINMRDGSRRYSRKTYRRTHDYLSPVRKDRQSSTTHSTSASQDTSSSATSSGSWTWKWDDVRREYVKDFGNTVSQSSSSASASSGASATQSGEWEWNGSQWVRGSSGSQSSANSLDERPFTWEWDDRRREYVKRYGDLQRKEASAQISRTAANQQSSSQWVWLESESRWVEESSLSGRSFSWEWSDEERQWIKRYFRK